MLDAGYRAQSAHTSSGRLASKNTSASGVLGRFSRDKRGSTAIIFALSIYPIMLLIGTAVDFGRVVTVKARMQAVLDSAVLAGANEARTATGDSTAIVEKAHEVASAYFNSMQVSHVAQKELSPPIANASMTEFTWIATSWVKTPFLSAGAITGNRPPADPPPGQQRPAECNASWWNCQMIATKAAALLMAGGQNNGYSIEVSMMLDVTGSMSAMSGNVTRMEAMKSAANDAVDILIWADQSEHTARIALAPFSPEVRLPTRHAFEQAVGFNNVSTGTNKPQLKTVWHSNVEYGQPNNQFCVVERMGPNRYTDLAPNATNGFITPRRLPLHTSGSNAGTVNGSCAIPTSATVVPLTSDKTLLKNRINALNPSGMTAGQIGTAWAWYTLSPNFNSLWEDSTNHASSYEAENVRKIAILMTDGEYNQQYNLAGHVASNASASGNNATSQNQAREMCRAMLDKGIELYSVGFHLSSGPARFLRDNCSSSPSHHYDTHTADALRMAFRDIALKVSSLRLSQ